MRKLLHIVKDIGDAHVRNVIQRQSETADVEVTVVLVQNAVKTLPDWKAKIYAQEDDAKKAGVAAVETINSARLVELVFEADAVTVW